MQRGILIVLLLENLRLRDSKVVVIFGRKFTSTNTAFYLTKWFPIDDLDVGRGEAGVIRA